MALILIEQMLDLFESETPQNTDDQTEHHRLNLNTETSPNTPLNTRVICPANIDSIDVKKLPHFSLKTVEIVRELQRCAYFSWRFQTVGDDFYSLDLDVRARDILGAPSTSHLCKSLLMRNSKCSNADCADRRNAKYYLLLFQYDTKLRQQKLQKFVKKMSGKSNKFVKFSLASPEETRALTRFEFNCVSPFGVGDIPIIISHRIIEEQLKYIWMGSGSLRVKLRIDSEELCRKLPHFVADITV